MQGVCKRDIENITKKYPLSQIYRLFDQNGRDQIINFKKKNWEAPLMQTLKGQSCQSIL